MRIYLMVIIFFFSIIMKVEGEGVNQLNYKFYVTPTAGPERVDFEIAIKNDEDFPLHFEFPTSQIMELTVLDSNGKEVYVYSKGRFFLQAFQTVTIEPHQTFKRIEKWDYLYKGKRVLQGEYTVKSFLLPTRLNDEPIKDRSRLISIRKMIIPEENPVFRHIEKEGNKGSYFISGEARTGNGMFYFTVEDGHIEFMKERQYVFEDESMSWVPFKIQIQIPQEKLPSHGSLILHLYERSKENKIIHTYPVILEKFE